MYSTCIRVLLLLLLANSAIDVHGWGFVGHGLVARLAQSRLTGETSAWVKQLIPWHWNGELSSMSAWADQILYNDSNPTGYPNWQWSRPHHFLNTPDWLCEYQRARDCANEHCIHGAILNFTSRLTEDLPEVQHQEALFFLIHHLGDIHQPLHTGFVSDYGGNSVRGFFLNSTRLTNLHTLWDSQLITHRLDTNFSSNASLYYDYLYDLMVEEEGKGDESDEIEDWVRENLRLVCNEIYFDEQGETMNRTLRFQLNVNYYQRSIPIVEERLVRAGMRLARLLNRIVAERRKPVTVVVRNNWIIFAIGAAVLTLVLILFVGVILLMICRKSRV